MQSIRGGDRQSEGASANSFRRADSAVLHAAALAARAPVRLNRNLRTGYDPSYFFIAGFMDDHLRFHAQQLAR